MWKCESVEVWAHGFTNFSGMIHDKRSTINDHHQLPTINLLITKAVKKIFYLVPPELGLVFDVFFIGKILYQQYGLIGDVRFFYAKFKELFDGRIGPVEAHKFIQLAFQNLCFGCRTVPGETKNIIALVNFVSKPFLKACRGT